ncbi:MAG: hypothetical protein ACHQF3_01820 [Alphaproteobacteria bacterium]
MPSGFSSSLPRLASCAAALLLAAALLAASGATVKARAGDAVALFTQLVKPALLPGELTWRSAVATGQHSLVLNDVVLSSPSALPVRLPLHIARVTIDDIDFDGLRRGDAPWALRARLEGIAVGPAALMLPIAVNEALGPGPYRANLTIDYKVRAGRVLRIDNLVLDIPGLARLQLSAELGGLAANGGRLKGASVNTLTLRSGRLVYDDRSLLAKVVAGTARGQNASEKLIIAEWSTLLGITALKEGTGALPLLDVLLTFLKDFQAPKGPLRITFTAPPEAPGGLPIAAALTTGIMHALGPNASYAGVK